MPSFFLVPWHSSVSLPAGGCNRLLKYSGEGALCGKRGSEGPLCSRPRRGAEVTGASALLSRLPNCVGEPLRTPKSSFREKTFSNNFSFTLWFCRFIVTSQQLALTDCRNTSLSSGQQPYPPGIYFFVAVQVLGHQAVSLQLDLQFAALYRREENWGKSK